MPALLTLCRTGVYDASALDSVPDRSVSPPCVTTCRRSSTTLTCSREQRDGGETVAGAEVEAEMAAAGCVDSGPEMGGTGCLNQPYKVVCSYKLN